MIEDTQKYSFVSFVDPDTRANLGCCVLECIPYNASYMAKFQGINPGGEVEAYELTEAEYKAQGMELNRLYKKQEMIDMGFQDDEKTKDTDSKT